MAAYRLLLLVLALGMGLQPVARASSAICTARMGPVAASAEADPADVALNPTTARHTGHAHGSSHASAGSAADLAVGTPGTGTSGTAQALGHSHAHAHSHSDPDAKPSAPPTSETTDCPCDGSCGMRGCATLPSAAVLATPLALRAGPALAAVTAPVAPVPGLHAPYSHTPLRPPA